MNLRREVAQGAAWSAVKNWSSQAFSLVAFLLLARLLAPADFGLAAMVGVFVWLAQTILDGGFADAIIQREDLEPEHLDAAFWATLAAGCLMTLVGILAAPLVALFFRQPELTALIRVISLGFLLISLDGVPQALLRRRFKFKVLALRATVSFGIGGAVGVLLALRGWGVWSLIYMQLAGSASGLVMWGAIEWRPRLRFSIRHWRDLFAFGSNVLGVNLLNFVGRQIDSFLIGYFLGAVALGYYYVATRVLMVLTQLLVESVQATAMPLFSRLQRDEARLRQAFYAGVRLCAFIAYPFFFGLAALAPQITLVFFGERWLPSAELMRLLALPGALYANGFFNGPMIKALGRPSWNLRLKTIDTIIHVIFFVVAVRWGIAAVAVAFLACNLLMLPLGLWVVSKLLRINLRDYFGQCAAQLFASLAMAALVIWLSSMLDGVMSVAGVLAICVAFGGITYFAAMRLLAPHIMRDAIRYLRLATGLPGRTI